MLDPACAWLLLAGEAAACRFDRFPQSSSCCITDIDTEVLCARNGRGARLVA